ncbi:hypothetical protein FB567DRAFT_618014 [Paraphoma chrysanthemicola]|uniref:Zn(2)-C6 fungal-type domain-containing protein n=1 Tax=Paraphoma chrysanthemicola TaxID=798071 RepID=A0A8K0R943_9PLEO|nr:hypothetical protein FB567DRAFT_618014 [Paraphoma chrysanthemicola]
MFPHQGGQGQLPTHWQPPTSQQPANGSYPPPAHMGSSLPPPPPQEPRPDMAAHQHPQYQQPYRLPGPNEWNRGPPPQDPYRGQPPPPPQYVQQHHQPPAPRQRTAIACRYCRRRKIRCSGFEATEDGRCSNCMRFNQDCIFTPVSAQTQAFVPAHTVWRGVGQPPPMYGAYGQPLPPASHAEAYQQQRPQQQYLPSPTAGPYPAHSEYGPPSAAHDEAGREQLVGRKRPHPEPHTPTLPPPTPGAASHAPHRGTGPDYAYPEPTPLTPGASTAAPNGSYPNPPPPGAQPYYAAQPPRQASPQSAYRYEPSRTSSSPHSQAPTTPGSAPAPYYNAPLQPPPPRSDGRTPPPPTTQASATRPSMRINDLVSDNGPARSSTDSSMLNMLNRRPM